MMGAWAKTLAYFTANERQHVTRVGSRFFKLRTACFDVQNN